MKRSIALLGMMVAAGCTSLTPAEDPIYLRMTDMEARLIRIERVVENESLIQLTGQLDALQNEMQLLRGEIETLQFESNNAANRQRDLYVDLDSRLQSLESNRSVMAIQTPAAGVVNEQAAGNAVTTLPSAPPVPVGSDQDNYNAAFELIQAREYDAAATAFTNFLATFPNSPLADNAQYWLAETYYVQRQFTAALSEFQSVVDDYPSSAKLPDALLKIGYCNFELQQWGAARTALEQVSRQFPGTTAARLAMQRLERLNQETD